MITYNPQKQWLEPSNEGGWKIIFTFLVGGELWLFLFHFRFFCRSFSGIIETLSNDPVILGWFYHGSSLHSGDGHPIPYSPCKMVILEKRGHLCENGPLYLPLDAKCGMPVFLGGYFLLHLAKVIHEIRHFAQLMLACLCLWHQGILKSSIAISCKVPCMRSGIFRCSWALRSSSMVGTSFQQHGIIDSRGRARQSQ